MSTPLRVLRYGLCVAAASMLLLSAGCTVTTAKVDRVHVCAAMQAGQCVAHAATLPLDTAELHVTARLRHATEGTPIKVSWRYLGRGGMDIASVDLTAKESNSTVHGSLSRPTKGWPVGDYQVTVLVVADNTKPVSAAFKMGAAPAKATAATVAPAAPADPAPADPAPADPAPADPAPAEPTLAERHNKLVDEAAAALDVVADKIIAAGDDKAKLAKLNEELKALQQKLGKTHFTITSKMTPSQLTAAKAYSATKLGPIAKRLREHAAVLQANHDLEMGKMPKRAIAVPTTPIPVEAAPATKRPTPKGAATKGAATKRRASKRPSARRPGAKRPTSRRSGAHRPARPRATRP